MRRSRRESWSKALEKVGCGVGGKREDEEIKEEVERIVAEILARAEEEARKIDIESLAKQVLAEAQIIVRWSKKPFYIS